MGSPHATKGTPEQPPAVSDLVALLRERARQRADASAYLFLANGEEEQGRLSYRELDFRAKAIAARLQGLALPGQRALLLYPPGLDYIEAFFGCLYAGLVAVPVHPPSGRNAARLAAILADANPALVLGTSEWADRYAMRAARGGEPTWVCTDRLDAEWAGKWREPALSGASLALLQYTSGSTGDPKGVMVSHANLLANQEAIRQSFRHGAHSTVVGWLPLYHDMGLIGNLLQPLYVGASAVLMPPLAFLEKPARWLRAIDKYRAETSGGPNFAYDLCARKITAEEKRGLDLGSWTLAFNGAEPVRAATLERFAQAFAGCGFRRDSFYPCYGLAEATLLVSGEHWRGRADAAMVSCGPAAAGTVIRIVDPTTGRPCRDGESGEIWVAGPGVAQGYLNRPEESERVFRAALAEGADPGYRFLRTGDLGYLDRGGLHVSGRDKDLVILRGRNVHPQDVEQALLDGVAGLNPQGCAAFAGESGGEEALIVVAEITRDTARRGAFDALFGAMRETLAEALELTAAELVLVLPGAVPKTSSGKLRRQACRQAWLDGGLPVLARSGAGSAAASGGAADPALPPPAGPDALGRFVVEQAARLLRIPASGLAASASLRGLGLDSLKTVELKHAVERCLDTELPMAPFLEDQPIARLAESCLAWKASHPDREATHESHPDTATPSPDYPLSRAQAAIWAIHSRDPGSPVYNLQIALRVRGELDAAAAGWAFGQLLERHEILRTVYIDPGAGVHCRVLPAEAIATGWSRVDASAWSGDELRRDMERRACEPFDLARGPLLRGVLYDQGRHAHGLLFCAHHIAVDLWAVLILLEEFQRLHRSRRAGRDPEWPAPAVGYADFVRWQRRHLDSPAAETDWRYWRDRLAGPLPVLDLPTDFPRPATPEYRGGRHVLQVPSGLAARLRRLAAGANATPCALLLAAYQVLLQRHTRQPDLVVGTAASGRSHAGFAELVGNCVNPLPIRTRPAGPFQDYLREVQTVLTEALAHQDLPFSTLVERLQPGRGPGHWPVFQTLFVYRVGPSGTAPDLASLSLDETGLEVHWGEWDATPVGLEARGETFDFTLTVAEYRGGYLASFHYRRDLFAADTVARMAGHFQRLLEGIAAAPATPVADLPLLDGPERLRLLDEWNATRAEPPGDLSLHRLFELRAEQNAALEAVRRDGESLSYGELNARAGHLADYLRLLGVGAEVRVGVCMEQTPGLLVGLLGILKAGGAYVPLDPAYPPERIAWLLQDSGAALLLTQADTLAGLPPTSLPTVCLDRDWEHIAAAPARPAPGIRPEQLAYVIHTSGSTGLPKGVQVSHHNAVHSTLARLAFYPHPVRRFLLLSSFAFDSSVAGIFWTLGQGGCLVLPPEGARKDPAALAARIEREAISHLLCLPSLYGLLLEQAGPTRLSSLRGVIVAGEACGRDIAARHFALYPGAGLYNEYGPTEGTVWCSGHAIAPADVAAPRSIPIGRPIANARVYLLDDRLQPVPIGVRGELYLGGEGVARGYLGRPDLTAERFLPDPFGPAGRRLYRTGDLARWHADGVLEFLGRADRQLKLRGFRIEPGEIEARLLEHPSVLEAVVLAREDVPGDPRLVAYATARPPYAPVVDGHVRQTLPNGMAIVQYDPGETDYLYQQIFVEEGYLRHGIQLGERPCVFDVGANIGMFTLFVNHLRPDAKVYAFEPVPALCGRLRLNARLYGADTEVFDCGLSNVSERVAFTFYPKSTLMSGRYADRGAERQVVKSYLRNRERDDLEAIDTQLDGLVDGRLEGETLFLPVRTLSDIIRERAVERIDLLKIDVERCELEVLEGIAAADWPKIGQIVLEVEDSGGRLERVMALLHAQGFAVAREQESLLRGTPVYNLYARRPAVGSGSAPALSRPAPAYPAPLSGEAARGFLKERLPEALVPAACVILERLPLTPNGKLDREALPAPFAGGGSEARPAEPVGELEARLAGIWAEVLGGPRPGRHDNFFDLGGHSLNAVQAVVRIQDQLGIEVSVAELFEAPSVAGLAAVLAPRLDGSADGADPLEAMLRALEQLPEGEARRLLEALGT